MVVALGASDARASENAHGVGDIVERHGPIAKVIADRSAAALPAAARRGDQFAYELVVRLVVAERLFNPENVECAADAVITVLDAQDVRPKIVFVADVAARLEEVIDELRALVGIVR